MFFFFFWIREGISNAPTVSRACDVTEVITDECRRPRQGPPPHPLFVIGCVVVRYNENVASPTLPTRNLPTEHCPPRPYPRQISASPAYSPEVFLSAEEFRLSFKVNPIQGGPFNEHAAKYELRTGELELRLVDRFVPVPLQ